MKNILLFLFSLTAFLVFLLSDDIINPQQQISLKKEFYAKGININPIFLEESDEVHILPEFSNKRLEISLIPSETNTGKIDQTAITLNHNHPLPQARIEALIREENSVRIIFSVENKKQDQNISVEVLFSFDGKEYFICTAEEFSPVQREQAVLLNTQETFIWNMAEDLSQAIISKEMYIRVVPVENNRDGQFAESRFDPFSKPEKSEGS